MSTICEWIKEIIDAIKHGMGVAPTVPPDIHPTMPTSEMIESEAAVQASEAEVRHSEAEAMVDEVMVYEETNPSDAQFYTEAVFPPTEADWDLGLSEAVMESSMAELQRTPRMKALIVGISKYEDPENNLEGCDNDAEAMFDLLTKVYNCDASDIMFLTDEHATKRAILDGLTWLCEWSAKDDILIYYHSGHGTQIYDESGDEEDRLDEVLVPHDMNWDDPLTDDLIHEKFRMANPESYLFFICDTCFSGTMHRYFRRTSKKSQNRFMTPPVERVTSPLMGSEKPILRVKPKTVLPNQLLLSGCQENEISVSAQFAEGWYGALTYCFVKLLSNYSGTWREISDEIIRILKANDFDQNPNIIASDELLDRKIF